MQVAQQTRQAGEIDHSRVQHDRNIVKAKAAANQDGDRDKPGAEQQGPRMPPTSGAFHTFVGLDTKHDEKVIMRIIHATVLNVS